VGRQGGHAQEVQGLFPPAFRQPIRARRNETGLCKALEGLVEQHIPFADGNPVLKERLQ
jgi:hypothetical protein